MAKKYSVKNEKKESGAVIDKKSLALLLVLSFVIFLTVYFTFVRQRIIWIVYVYWAVAALVAILYAILSRALALAKLENEPQRDRITRYEKGIKGCLLILLPVIVALLADYMLLSLGIAKYLGL